MTRHLWPLAAALLALAGPARAAEAPQPLAFADFFVQPLGPRGLQPTPRLLAAVGRRMAERLRDANRQQRVYHQLLNSMQTEVDLLQRQLHQVMDGRTARQGAPD